MDKDEELTIAEAKRRKHSEQMARYLRRKNWEYLWMRSNLLILANEVKESAPLRKLLSEGSYDFLMDVIETWPVRYPPLLLKLYDGKPEIGVTVTAKQTLERIYKGRTDMKLLLKRWAKKGFVVEHRIDPEGGALDETYTLVEVPSKRSFRKIDVSNYQERYGDKA